MLILSAAMLLVSALSVSQAAGSIAGCIADASGQRLPGVTVVATGESSRHTTETNTSGCYELKALPPGPYRVTARVGGFNNYTRDNVAVAAGAATALDVAVSISPTWDGSPFKGSLADYLKEADAVLHLRIAAPTGTGTSSSIYYRHAATVLRAIKGPSQPGTTVALLQNQRSGAPLPYDTDHEIVAFLRSIPERGYTIMNDDAEVRVGNVLTRKIAMAFVVRDGRIADAPADFSQHVGRTLDSFMADLRAGAAAK